MSNDFPFETGPTDINWDDAQELLHRIWCQHGGVKMLRWLAEEEHGAAEGEAIDIACNFAKAANEKIPGVQEIQEMSERAQGWIAYGVRRSKHVMAAANKLEDSDRERAGGDRYA